MLRRFECLSLFLLEIGVRRGRRAGIGALVVPAMCHGNISLLKLHAHILILAVYIQSDHA